MEIAKNRTYAELANVGKKYYNDSQFCSVIAIASLCNMSFGRAYRKLKTQGRKKAKGVNMFQMMDVLSQRGFKAVPVDVSGFVRTAPRKLDNNCNYMILVSGHVVAIVNGVVNDWTGLPNTKQKRIISAYKIVKKGA